MSGMSRASSSWMYQHKIDVTHQPLPSVNVILFADSLIAVNKTKIGRDPCLAGK